MARWLLLAALALAAGSPTPRVFGQGSLTPPGPPAPTMKTLAQIEPRTPISSAPFTISEPGSYYLTGNLSVSGGNAITIAADGVTLDLNGFTIASTAPGAEGTAILINSGLRNLAILNGFIKGGVVNSGGVYSGSGFGYGIYGNSQNVRISGVSVSGCLYYGIYLGTDTTVVECCTVRTVGSYGILASIVKGSMAIECGEFAIYGYEVADCRGECTGSSIGLCASRTAQNCYGYSNSGYGLSAHTAQNCYGFSSSGNGLSAATAQNCYGYSAGGTGLDATTAQNCFGQSDSAGSTGLYAATAQNCYGLSNGVGYGIYAIDIAISCSGYSNSGTGLSAYIANSCRGITTYGTAENISHKYNMP